MAANWELQLLSAVLTREDRIEAYLEACEAGLAHKHFGTMEARSVWAHIETYYTRPRDPGRIPSKEAVQETFRNLDLPRPAEAVTDLVQKVIGGHVTRSVQALLEAWDTESTVDTALASLLALKDGLSEVHESHSSKDDVSWREVALAETAQDMCRIDEEAGLTGLPYPWEVMNREIGGIQPEDLILIWALPKSKKTWIGLYMVVNLFLLGYRVVVYSKEMSWANIRRRMVCIIANVSYKKYKDGTCSEGEKDRILQAVDITTASWHRGDLFFTNCDRPDGTVGGPGEIREKIEKYRADIVFCDSSYLLQLPGVKDAMDWKAIGAVTRALKQVARQTKIPIIAIMQENEKSAYKYKKSRGTASIGGYTGVAQDCDLGIHIVNNPRENKTALRFAAARETEFPGFVINTVLCEDFSHDPDSPLWNVGDFDEDDEGDGSAAARATQTRAAVEARREAMSTLGSLTDRYGEGPAVTVDRSNSSDLANEIDSDLGPVREDLEGD